MWEDIEKELKDLINAFQAEETSNCRVWWCLFGWIRVDYYSYYKIVSSWNLVGFGAWVMSWGMVKTAGNQSVNLSMQVKDIQPIQKGEFQSIFFGND